MQSELPAVFDVTSGGISAQRLLRPDSAKHTRPVPPLCYPPRSLRLTWSTTYMAALFGGGAFDLVCAGCRFLGICEVVL